jgi:DNA-binding NarL/FixJ family response regulator
VTSNRLSIETLIPALVSEFANPPCDTCVVREFHLSPSELRVAAATIRGLDSKGVGRHLCISVKTVEHHLSSIYRKMNVRTRQELAAQVIRHLLSTDPDWLERPQLQPSWTTPVGLPLVIPD